MKKRFLTLAVVIVTVISSAFARNEEGVSKKAISSFQKEFVNASDVKWEITKDYFKATFKLNDQVLYAFYSEEGNMIAMTRNIRSNQLPIRLSSDLKNNYKDFWITDLFEMASDNQTTYYATVESADNKVVLKSDSFGGWQVFKKEKKSVL